MSHKLNKLYRITIILLALLLAVPNLVLEYAHALPGSGTLQDPYRISTRAELVEFLDSSSNFSGQHVVLTADIVVNSMNADRTVFNSRNKVNPKSDFKGTFDGRGYEIIGLDIKEADAGWFASANDEVGLFRKLSGGAVIKDVRVSGSVEGGKKGFLGGSDSSRIGGIAGVMEGAATIVQNCSFVGIAKAAGTGGYVGGIAGEFKDGTIENCDVGGGSSYNATITGTNYIGGIAGSQNGTLIDCSFSGSVQATGNAVGGITGDAKGGRIERSWAAGDVKGSAQVGGIAGSQNCTLIDCNFSGSVQATGNTAGGIAGEFVGGTIENCDVGSSSRNAAITGTNYVGGIAGAQSGTIIDCAFSGSVEAGNKDAGGITGDAKTGKIESCSVDATIKGKTEVGGIAGKTANNFLIKYCEVKQTSSVEGTITTGTSTMAGGIAGLHAGKICNSVNSGYVKGRGRIGGIAGELSTSGIISNSLNNATVEVTATTGSAGGIAGYTATSSTNSVMQKNVNLGTVTGNSNSKGSIGGFPRTNVGSNLKWNYYRYYSGAPTAYTGSKADYGAAYDWAGAPVGSNHPDHTAYAGLSWVGLIVNPPDNYLNKDTGSPCGGNAFYLDPANNWLPMVNLSGDGPPAMPAIVRVTAGKQYAMPSNPWSSSELPITGDSAFTASYEFLMNIGCAPADLVLSLDQNNTAVPLPVGTSVIIAAKGAFYYYNVSVAQNALRLGDFYQMGTLTTPYSGPSMGGQDDKEYVVIFDFAGVDPDHRLPNGSYKVLLRPPQAMRLAEDAKVLVTAKQVFDYDYLNPVNGFRIKLNANPAAANGYDHQIGTKPIVLEFYLTDGIGGPRWPLPVGSTINGIPVTAVVPYHILPISLTNYNDYTILLPPGMQKDNLYANGIAYASEDASRPRGGHILKQDIGIIEFTAPEVYALKTSVAFMSRYLDRMDTAQNVSVSFESLGSSTSLRTTLQRKVDGVYIDVPGHVNSPVLLQLNATSFSLIVPAGSPKGTYRFIISLHDSNGLKRAQTIENIIIK